MRAVVLLGAAVGNLRHIEAIYGNMINKTELQKLHKDTKPWLFHTVFGQWLSLQPDDQSSPSRGTRTDAQSRSIHLWLELVAEELDRHGHTVQDIVEKIRRAEIRPNKTVLKEVLWRPYQIAALQKESTTELTKHEVDKVYEGLNKFLADNFDGLHIPFPSDETRQRPLTEARKIADSLEYPVDEYPEGPTF